MQSYRNFDHENNWHCVTKLLFLFLLYCFSFWEILSERLSKPSNYTPIDTPKLWLAKYEWKQRLLNTQVNKINELYDERREHDSSRESLFRDKSRDSSVDSLPSEDGIPPLKMLFEKLSTLSPLRPPIESGISPWNLLLEKSITTRTSWILRY